MKTQLLMVILFTSIQASATNYYLSEKGNDLQNGTSARAPWRSLKKLSEVINSLQPGDSILFERGSVFNGELKISASGKPGKPIYVGAYGSGLKPIIRGSVEVADWTPFRGNIWVANCNTVPVDLFIDDHCQSLGRYPNEGYLPFSCNSQCTTFFTDNAHGFANGYWDGAEAVVKSSRWTLDILPVANYFNKTFHCSVASSYPLPTGFGYFLQNHLSTLDRPGEWFFDRASGKLYVYCTRGDNPGSHVIEVSATDVGLALSSANFLTIENIAFTYHRKLGVRMEYSTNIILRNCDIENAGQNGMEITSCQSPTIEHCRIRNSNNNGVEWRDNTNGSFTRNTILGTGLRAGRGTSGNGTYIGLSITANMHQQGNNLFQFNSIDSTGYLGIDFRTGGTSIKNNLVSHFCMVKDDGAGIYTWGNAFGRNKIDGNIVLHGVGNGNGTNDPDQAWVSGIYIDDRSSDIDVTNNTVAFCNTNGIYIHNARRISVSGNTLFGNGGRLTTRENAQLCIKRDALVPIVEGETLDLHIRENRFVTFQEGNHCIYLAAEKEQHLKGLEFDQNIYMATNPGLAIAKLFYRQEMCVAPEELTLPQWAQTGCDKNSQFILIGKLPETASPNLVRNGRMTKSTQGWITWPSDVSVVHDKSIGVDAPSVKVLLPQGRDEALLYYAGISLSNNKWYRLSFSARSIAKSKVEFVPLMATAPWEALDDYACFSLDTNFKSFTYFFRPNRTNNLARLNFKSNASFWLDNVTLSEVGPDPRPGVQLFYNAGEKQKVISMAQEFKDIAGHPFSGKLVLQGYSSQILLGPH